MILRIIATLLLSCSLATATATYSGKFVFPDSSGSVPGSASLILKNCGGNFPLVSGVAINPNEPEIPLNSDGTWSKVLYRNDEISCNGSFTTVYTLIYKFNGRQVGPARDYFCTQSTCNLDSMTPVTTIPPPPPPQPPTSGARTFVFTQSIASTVWTISHNFSVLDVIAVFYDLNSKQIYPDTVTETNISTLTVTFVSPQAGRALVINVGNFTPTITNPNYIISNPTGSQSITGGFDFNLDGNFIPLVNNSRDLGSSTFKWRDGWFSRNMSVGGTLGVTGDVTLSNNFFVTGNTFLTGALSVGTTLTIGVGGSANFSGSPLKNATLNGAANGNSVTLLNQQSETTAITGTGATATIYTYTLPANTVGQGKGIRVTVAAFHSGGSASTSFGSLFGSTARSLGSTTNTSGVWQFTIMNKPGLTTAQTYFAIGSMGPQSGAGVSVQDVANALAENTATNLTVAFQFNVANTDTWTGISFTVELIQ